MEIRIGKRGLDAVMKEIERQLRAFKKIKIRLNRKLTGRERRNYLRKIAKLLENRFNAKAKRFVGRTFELEVRK